MTFNYMPWETTTKTNRLKAALCNTRTHTPHNSTIETNAHIGKRSKFPAMQTEPPIFFSFNFNIEYINEIGLNVLAPLFPFSCVPLLYSFKAVYIGVRMCLY